MILDLSFGLTDNRYEMPLDLVSGADFRGRSRPFFEPHPVKGVSGPRWPENGPKLKLKLKFRF